MFSEVYPGVAAGMPFFAGFAGVWRGFRAWVYLDDLGRENHAPGAISGPGPGAGPGSGLDRRFFGR